MLPQYPDIIECFSCSAIFLISEQPEIDEREPVILNWRFLEKFRGDHPGWAGAHDLLHHRTSAQTYLKCINLDNIKQHEEYPEIELRMSAWHRFNDQYRDAEAPKAIKWTSEQRRNADAFINLLDDSYSSDRVILAEIYRQLGNFEKSLALLRGLDADQETELSKKIRALAKANNNTLDVVDF